LRKSAICTLPRMPPGESDHAAGDRARPAPGWAVRCAQLLPVLALILFVRVWLVHHTAIIANDGARWYTPMARQWSLDPRATIRGYILPVGYPAATAALHHIRAAWGTSDSLEDWDRSGQWVSVGASVAAMIALWLLTGMTFNWRVAWMTTLLFGVTRKWSADSADVLSDALAVCMELWAAALAVVTMRWIQRKSWWSLLWAGGTGVLAAGGYLVRPEAVFVAALAALLWLAFQLACRRRWRLTLSCLAVMMLAAASCALPYMIEIRGFTKKKTISDFAVSHRLPSPQTLLAWTPAPTRYYYQYVPWRQLLNKLFEAMHPVLGFLACIWLAAWIAARIRRTPMPGQIQACPRRSGGFLMIVSLILIGSLTIAHYAKAGGLSHRYLLFPAALLSALAAASVLVLAHACGFLAQRLGWARSRGWFLPAILAAILAGLLLYTLRPHRQDKAHHVDAARFLRQRAAKGDFLLTDSLYVLRHAGIPGYHMPPTYPALAVHFLTEIRRKAATLVAVQEDKTRENRPEIAHVLRGPAFTTLGTFVSRATPSKSQPIHVYRVNRAEAEALLKVEWRKVHRERAKAKRRS